MRRMKLGGALVVLLGCSGPGAGMDAGVGPTDVGVRDSLVDTQPDAPTDVGPPTDAAPTDAGAPPCESPEFLGNPLYVSLDGNDSVSRSDNTRATPWRTVRQAMLNAQAGDVVYFLEGRYTIESEIVTAGANEGTAEQRVVFTNFEDDLVTFTGARIRIDRQYWTISGINAQTSGMIFWIGKDGNADHFILENGRFELDAFGGAGNVAPVQFQTAGSGDALVRNCVFVGPGSEGNQNTAGIFVWRSQGIRILNNEFSNFPSALFYKHPGVGFDTGIEIANNYFHDNAVGLKSVPIYAAIHDNLFVRSGLVLGQSGGTGDDGANEGGDHNTISHNTFAASTLSLIGLGGQDAMGIDINRDVEERDSDGDGAGNFSIGATNNTVRDNLFSRVVRLIPFKDLRFHNNQMSYNLHPDGVAVRNNGIDYTLSEWDSEATSNSISGPAMFVGGESPAGVDGFALTSSSRGSAAASDGQDMGANIPMVGVGRACP